MATAAVSASAETKWFEQFEKAFPESRRNRLSTELRQAFTRMTAEDLKRWSSQTIRVLALSVWRRLRTIGVSLRRLGVATRAELERLYGRPENETLWAYLWRRIKAFWDGSRSLALSAKRSGEALITELRANPKEAGPRFLVAVLGYVLASGGLDADGGAPDLDLEMGGIGLHRSIFFHSFLIGAVLETAIYGLACSMEIAHEKLPTPHDPFWDLVDKHRTDWAVAATNGISVGVAYHLLVDAFIQTGTYHGIGIPLPGDIHSAGFAANAAVEGMDVGRKGETFKARK